MAINIEKILSDALGLPPSARAYVAEKLIGSLDAEIAPALSDAWKETVGKRCREIDEEIVELREAQDVFDRAYSKIK